jgi:hypothetical protein
LYTLLGSGGLNEVVELPHPRAAAFPVAWLFIDIQSPISRSCIFLCRSIHFFLAPRLRPPDTIHARGWLSIVLCAPGEHSLWSRWWCRILCYDPSQVWWIPFKLLLFGPETKVGRSSFIPVLWSSIQDIAVFPFYRIHGDIVTWDLRFLKNILPTRHQCFWLH